MGLVSQVDSITVASSSSVGGLGTLHKPSINSQYLDNLLHWVNVVIKILHIPFYIINSQHLDNLY